MPWSDLRADRAGEPSPCLLGYWPRARQLSRQGCLNARLEGRALRAACALGGDDAETLLATGVARLRLSARGVMRVLCAARTVADLEGSATLTAAHVAEALQFRVC